MSDKAFSCVISKLPWFDVRDFQPGDFRTVLARTEKGVKAATHNKHTRTWHEHSMDNFKIEGVTHWAEWPEFPEAMP
jgi:hypothetical protein